VGYKVNINEKGLISKGQLIKQVTSTASFSQFQFKMLVPAAGREQVMDQETLLRQQEPASKSQDDDFDSIWSSL
jgi:hypothetical protein